MRSRTAITVAVVAVATLGLVVTDLAVWLAHRSGSGYSYDYWLEGTLASGVILTVGAMITLRVPANRLGPLMLVMACVATVQELAGTVAVTGAGLSWPRSLVVSGAWVSAAAQIWLVALLLTFIVLAPSGTASRRIYRRYLVVLVVATAVASLSAPFIGPDAVQGYPEAELVPLVGGTAGQAARWAWLLSQVVVALGVVVAPVSLIDRWRHSAGEDRRQVTWVVLGGVGGPVMIVTLAVADVWLTIPPLVGSLVWGLAPTMLPLGIAVAVLRHGLYQLDRVVSRVVSYAAVTGIVLLAYIAVVTAASVVLPDSSSLGVAAATLAAAALARPILRRVQGRVDRQFNRAAYDAHQTVERFGHQLRHQVDPDAITHDLVHAITETLQPASVGLLVVSQA